MVLRLREMVEKRFLIALVILTIRETRIDLEEQNPCRLRSVVFFPGEVVSGSISVRTKHRLHIIILSEYATPMPCWLSM